MPRIASLCLYPLEFPAQIMAYNPNHRFLHKSAESVPEILHLTSLVLKNCCKRARSERATEGTALCCCGEYAVLDFWVKRENRSGTEWMFSVESSERKKRRRRRKREVIVVGSEKRNIFRGCFYFFISSFYIYIYLYISLVGEREIGSVTYQKRRKC